MSRCTRLALVAALVATFALPAAAQTADDRAAIEKLMWTYDRMLDTYNADPTTARYHYYHQTVFGTGGEKSPDPARIAAAGNGVDDLVKVDGQWLIKYRNVAAADDK